MQDQEFSTNDLTIIQWDCSVGVSRTVSEIVGLTELGKPNIVCIQHTRLTAEKKINFRSYQSYRKDFLGEGVLILAHESLDTTPIEVPGSLQAVAIKVKLKESTINVYSLFLPEQNFEKGLFQDFLSELQAPYVLCGNFNAENKLWGSSTDSVKGRNIADVYVEIPDVVLLNDKSPTFFNTSDNTYSNVDLSFCSSSLYARTEWKVYKGTGQYAFNHFPILIKIKNAAENDVSIQKTPQVFIAGWNKEVEKMIQERNKASKQYRKHKIPENLSKYKQARSAVRKMVKELKEKSWVRVMDIIKILYKLPSSKVFWSQLEKVDKEMIYAIIHDVRRGNDLTIEDETISNQFGKHFSKITNHENYYKEFAENY